MRNLLAAAVMLFAAASWAEEAKGTAADTAPAAKAKAAPKDADLGKKETSAVPDKSLAGDLTRKKDERGAAPALQYDQFRLGVELQVASKRREQIQSLKKIIGLTPDPKEAPGLLFRLGELYWEESKFFFFEANRKDDDLINAMNRKDKAGQDRAKQEKEEVLAKSKEYNKLALDQYQEIVQRYKDYERMDEVLYFLGHGLMEQGEDRKALIAYKRLLEKYPKSRYVPDAHFAFGEYYFNTSKGKRDMLEKALDSYKKAAAYPDNQVYGFALYKQGWCYFNMTDFQKAMDMFKAVILYGEYAGAGALEKDGGKGGKNSLMREARNDFVRAYARIGNPTDARAEFAKVAKNPDDRFTMMKQLANLYYEDGKDREAALTYNALIKEKPLSPEAPGFQGKIVDCVLRAGNKKMTVEQVRRLVKIMNDVEKSGMVKSDKDKKAMEEAKELSERTISNLAVNWHNEARKTRDEETYVYANDVYSDYLTLFPDNPKAYDLRFFWAELLHDNLQKYEAAADQYTKVLMMDVKRMEEAKKGKGKVKAGKWMTNAAYNAVLSLDEVVRKGEESGQVKTETSTDPNKKLAIHPLKKQLIEACERYLKYIPNGDKRVEISYKLANIYYRHNYFDEAVARFADIAMNHPDYKFENGERAGEIAANLVLDSYNLTGEPDKVNEWARKFYNNEKLAQGKFKDELSAVIEQSAFKLVNQLEARKEYAAAAEAYLTFVTEFPKSNIADKALFNASIDFYNGKMVDKSIETRKRLISQYPKSVHVPPSIYANAEAFEAIGEFDEAADHYELYVAGYEGKSVTKRSSKAAKKSKKKNDDAKADAAPAAAPQVWEEGKAQIALYNAGVFREGLGQYKQAQKNRERYLDLWPKAKDSETIFLSMADLYEKQGAYAKAIKHLENYEKEYGKDNNKLFPTEGRIAGIYENKMKRGRDAGRVYARLNASFDKLGPKGRKALDNPALEAAAKANYLSIEPDFQKYAKMQLKWGRMPAPEKEFKERLKDKAKALEALQKQYTATVALKAGDPAICALMKIGMAYDNFADALVNAPMPKGAPEELQLAIKDELNNQATPVRAKATEAFVAAVQKSQELDVYNTCSAQAVKQLSETQNGPAIGATQEEFADLPSSKPMVIGGDVLAAVQPIPVVSKSQAERNKKALKELKDNTSDVGSKANQAGKSQEVPADDAVVPAADEQPSSKGSAEPEDIL
jgi:cellulose synthase operon protein C